MDRLRTLPIGPGRPFTNIVSLGTIRSDGVQLNLSHIVSLMSLVNQASWVGLLRGTLQSRRNSAVTALVNGLHALVC